MAVSGDNIDMDINRSPADCVLYPPAELNKRRLRDMSEKFSNSLEKQKLTTEYVVHKATNLDPQQWTQTDFDGKTEGSEQSSKLTLSVEMQRNVSEKELFEDISSLEEGYMAGEDIMDGVFVDLRSRKLVHVSDDNHQSRPDSQSKTFLEDHAHFGTFSCQGNTTGAYDGIDLLDVFTDTKPAQDSELLLHDENTLSRATVTLPPNVGEETSVKAVGNSMSQNRPPKIQTTQTIQSTTAHEICPQLTEIIIPQAYLQPQKTQTTLLPPTAQNVWPQRTQNILPQTTQPETIQSLIPPTQSKFSAQKLQQHKTHNLKPKTIQTFQPLTAHKICPLTTQNLQPNTIKDDQHQLQIFLSQIEQNTQFQAGVQPSIQVQQSLPQQVTEYLIHQNKKTLSAQTVPNPQEVKAEYLYPHSAINITANEISQGAAPDQHDMYSDCTRSVSPMSVCSDSSSSLSRSQSIPIINSDVDKKYYTCSSKVKHAIQKKICPSKGQCQPLLEKRFHPYPPRQQKYQTTLPNLPDLNHCFFSC